MIASLLRRGPADGEQVDVDGVAVRLRVNPRARRISLRIDGRTGEAVATAPNARRLAEAAAFARSKPDWLRSRLARRPAAAPLIPGAEIPYRGERLRLQQTPSASAARLSEDGAVLIAGGDAEGFARRVETFLKRQARAELTARTAAHAAALGLPSPTLTLRDTRSRWGSCNAARRAVNYSWRLILCPPAVLDYVAAHEVAHLVEPNHGPRFWALVERLYDDPSAERDWLRRHGAGVHAVGRA